jgi:FtsP/CotA-like multicopper oxidase with cupredoxin domain
MPFNIGGGNPLVTNAETYDGAIPRPPILLDVGDTLIVRLINDLPYPTGIHWHGIELENYSDGTEVTQSEVPGAPLQVLGNGVPAGGTFLYKFKVPRPGIFWFHPHHHHSTNRVFRGQYGMIAVKDADEDTLVANGVLPPVSHRLVLSDITVCRAVYVPGEPTYVNPNTILIVADRPEWLSGLTAQNGLTPQQLCQTAPLDDAGMPGAAFAEGEIPNTFKMVQAGTPTVEGQTVLTNGVNVGGRKGIPLAAPGGLGPGALDPGYTSITAQPGQAIRLQILNAATTRYFRLILTTAAGAQIDLIRVGGEGGILNDAIKEGGMLGGYNSKYTPGEVLLPAASRADVVAVIPLGTDNTTCTMWTRDFERTGGGYSGLPTVPVLHIDVGNAPVPLFPMIDGTALKSTLTPTLPLGAPTDPVPFVDPGTFLPVKPGAPSVAIPTQEIRLTAGGGTTGVNGVQGSFDLMPYTLNPHIGSTRYAKAGNVLQFRVVNQSNAHHPFHLHGFSFHPVTLETNAAALLYTWPANATEYRDNFDIPAGHTVTFKVHISPRELADGLTPGGALGRWLFHCHIFFHAHHGMISELVITDPDGTGSEKPNVNVNGSWAYAPSGGTATRTGTYFHRDGDAITLTSSLGPAPTDLGGGQWEWQAPGLPDQTNTFVYITATDAAGRQDQAVFRLRIGAPDDGSDNGDPHIHTVDGKSYDFQAVGEFTLLHDREAMEVQVRQWPVETANPITDAYSGLTTCVSVNTAVAARVGSHRIAYQPVREGASFQFYVDGKPAQLPFEGMDLDDHRVTAYTVDGGGTGLRVDYANNAVLIVTSHFWNSYKIWYLNVSVSHTQGDEGIMGSIPENSWLPTLPSGATVGPMPASLHDRYVALYKTFANAWRVTDDTSMFVYAPGTSTKTFTDEDWPAEKPPCKLKEQFRVPGANPNRSGIPIERAKKICQAVTIDDLHRDCVFDVATTGDEDFAKAYLVEQELRLRGCAVQIIGDKEKTRGGEPLVITATVLPLRHDCATPEGSVTFLVDGKAAGPAVKLDKEGRASFTTDSLKRGVHKIRAEYAGRGKESYHSCTSPNLLHTVVQPEAGGPTIRRVLRFLNAARSRADLMAGPARQIPLIDERQEHGIHLDEDHGGRAQPGGHGQGGPAHGAAGHGAPAQRGHGQGGHGQRIALFGGHTADHLLADRLEKSPIHGFAHIKDLLGVKHFNPELLDHLFETFGPGVYGEWEVVYGGAGTPFSVAHAALLHNGQVLFIPESFAATDTVLWNPEDSNHATAVRTLSGATTGLTGVLFCGAHCFLQDGKLLVVGGGTSAIGTVDAWKFDPIGETWQQTAGPMAAPRWYPTTVVLGEDSGRVLVANGGPGSMEIYSESSDSFVAVHGPTGPADPAANRPFPQLYPGLHLLPTGQIFFTRTGNNSGTDSAAYFTFVTPTSGSWTGLTGGSAGDDRGRGMSLLLLRQQPTDPDRILVIGGGNAATQTTVGLIDNPPSAAAWLSGSFPDGLARNSVNGVLLPDGKVLICGGRPSGGMPPNGGVCYLYDPSAGLGIGAFSEVDEVTYARQYHSVAILLPSAKVMITGGSSETIEVFSPPYLFNADGTPASRPVIDSYPDAGVGTIVLHGSTFQIGTAQAPDIARVVMVRPMAVTHQTDAEQRVLALSWSLTSPTTLTVTAPDGRIFPYAGGGGHTHVTAPRGYYMLFIINSSGVPSEAKFVRLV